jgi:ribosomal protein S18 acetylase RimI-like enzyme
MTLTGDVTIRRATEDDRQTLSALAQRLAAFPLPPWRQADEIAAADAGAMMDAVRSDRPDDEVFLALREKETVGCLHILASTDFFGTRHAHVSVLATSQAAEGSGVGRALMAHAEAWARRRHLSLLTLNVFAANERARRFYEGLGFTPETLKYVKPV